MGGLGEEDGAGVVQYERLYLRDAHDNLWGEDAEDGLGLPQLLLHLADESAPEEQVDHQEVEDVQHEQYRVQAQFRPKAIMICEP